MNYLAPAVLISEAGVEVPESVRSIGKRHRLHETNRLVARVSGRLVAKCCHNIGDARKECPLEFRGVIGIPFFLLRMSGRVNLGSGSDRAGWRRSLTARNRRRRGAACRKNITSFPDTGKHVCTFAVSRENRSSDYRDISPAFFFDAEDNRDYLAGILGHGTAAAKSNRAGGI